MEIYGCPCRLLLIRTFLIRPGSSCLVSHAAHVVVLILISNGGVLRERMLVIHAIRSNDLATVLLLTLD